MNNKETKNRTVFSGYDALDSLTRGFRPGELVVIASRPSMGKTALSLNLLRHAAAMGKKSLFFSLDVSGIQLLRRYISSDTGVETEKLSKEKLSETEAILADRSSERLKETGSQILDVPHVTIREIRKKCRESEPDLIIIDYLQLVPSDSGDPGSRRQDPDISRTLKTLACELECPVIVLSQLSGACEERTDKRPMMSDFRDPGFIGQEADLVMFLYRDEYYYPDTERKREAEVIIAKQKNGLQGTVKLCWQPETARFIV